jgi:hypothetical protein
MKHERKNIDMLFYTKLTDYEENLPNYLWDNIKEELDNNRKKKILYFVRGIAATIALLLAFATGYLFTSYVENPEQSKNIAQLHSDPSLAENNSSKTTESGNETQNKETPDLNSKTNHSYQGKYNTYAEKTDDTNKTNNQIANTERNKKTSLAQNINSEKEQESFSSEKLTLQNITAINSNTSTNNTNDDITNESGKINITILSYANQSIHNKSIINEDVSENSRSINKNAKTSEIETQKFEELIKNLNNDSIPETEIMGEFFVTNEDNNKKWSVGGQLSPLYSYRHIRNNPKDMQYDNQTPGKYSNKLDYDEIENSTISYTGGICVNYHNNTRWSFHSGVFYTQMGQISEEVIEHNNQGIIQPYSVWTSAGMVNATPRTSDLPIMSAYRSYQPENIENPKSDLIQQFEYIEIPFITKYKIINRKFALNILGGFSTNLLIGNNAYVEENGQKQRIGKTENVNLFNYNATVGFGVEYSISRKISINMEPTLKYSITPINRGNNVYSYPYSFGIFTGIYYNF